MNKKIITVVSLLVIIALVLALNFFVMNSFSSDFTKDNIKLTGESISDSSNLGFGDNISFNNTVKIIDSYSRGGNGGGGGGSSSENQNIDEDTQIIEPEAKTEILVYHLNINSSVYGLAISGNVYLPQKDSLVRVILVDSSGKEYLVYESYSLIADSSYFYANKACEETCFLDSINPSYLKIQLINSNFNVSSVDYSDSTEKKSLMMANSISTMEAIEKSKVEKMNENIQESGMLWVAGETSVSGLSYEDKKALFGVGDGEELQNLYGFEYYSGGIFEMTSEESSSLNSSTNSVGFEKSSFSRSSYGVGENISLTDSWDWRTRHGENWNTLVKCQDGCFVKNSTNDYVLSCSISHIQCDGIQNAVWKSTQTCSVFSATAATELLVNLYFNNHTDLDISEQEIISKWCSVEGYASGCAGSIAPSSTFSGVFYPEDCFPYFYPHNGTIESNINNVSYNYRCTAPNFNITLDHYSSISSNSLEQLKRNIIENGSITLEMVNDLPHAMALVGYGKAKAGDIIYTHSYSSNTSNITIPENYTANETFWIFKNSFGDGWGEGGYIKMINNSLNWFSSSSTIAYIPTVYNKDYTISCNDKDNDTYCNWGLFSTLMPTTCPAACYTHDLSNNFTARDCDDSNNSLGGFDSGYNCMLIDNIVPYFTTIPDVANINYTQGFGVQFNATDETGFGSYAINWTTLFVINQSGYLQNLTPNVGAGVYLINVTINDSSGNKNSTIWQIIVNKLDPSAGMSITETTPISYPQNSSFTSSENNTGDAGCVYTLTPNDIYGAGIHIFNYSTAGCVNYSAGSIIKNLTVTQNNTYALGISGTTPLIYGVATNVAGSACPAQLICSMNLENSVYGVGTLTFNYSSVGNANYSASSTTKIIVINQANSSIYTYINNSRTNLTIQKGTSVWLNGSRQIGEGNINLYNNGTLINVGINVVNLTAFNSVGLYNITSIYPNTQNYSTNFESFWLNVICTPNITNTTWTDWSNQSVCNHTDLQLQNRSRVQYDSRDCGSYTNSTNWDYQNISCNYCSYNLVNTTKSDWINTTCSGTQMNQSRSWIQYDSNNCYAQTGLSSDNFTNQTFFEYQLTGPNFANTTWTDWANLTCLSNDKMNQTRNLTQHDSYACSTNQTFYEYKATESCDFCTPNLANITGAWANLTCLSNDKMNQSRSILQYDTNSCGEISNQTFYEYKATESCDFCTPNITNTTWTDWINTTCSGTQMNQSRSRVQYDTNSCEEILNQTIYGYQLTGPNFANTTWTDWINITACMPGDYYNQKKNLTQYDLYSCSSNQTLFDYRNQTCDFCTPNLLNTTKTEWQNQGTCLFNDTQLQNQSWIEYDSLSCGEIENITHWETQIIPCDFCTPNLANTTWSSWINTTCSGTQMNQSRFFTQYDSLSCGEISNQTFYESQLVGPTYVNTSWSDWINTTCSGTQMNQSRFKIQYDIYSCANSTTMFEYNELTAPSQSCTVGVGACQRTGTQYRICNGASGWGDWGSCSVSAGTPGTETCNNIDDDCDGSVDEDLTTTSDCTQVGSCSGAFKTCSAGSWGQCSILPTTESCNNLDDDCDGSVDEDLTTTSDCSQTGYCSGAFKTCSAGAWSICSKVAQTEVCDNIDNDCDGSTDESLTTILGCNQIGFCSGGYKTCSAGNWGICSKLPKPETCNNVDDNCDGPIDNGLTAPSQSCTVGVGACQRTGTQYRPCGGVGGWGGWSACSVSAGTPTTETCNNIDDDCDGSTDEGLTQSQSCSVDVIACSKAGSQIRTCSAGSWGSWGRCSPTTECSETDYGNDIYTYGVTKGILLGGQYVEHADRCIVTMGGGGGYWVSSCTGANCAVDEAYCRCCEQSDGANCGTNMYGKYFVHTFPYFAPCPNGCSAGRCL